MNSLDNAPPLHETVQIDLDDIRCAECGKPVVSAFAADYSPRLTFACINPLCSECATLRLLVLQD